MDNGLKFFLPKTTINSLYVNNIWRNIPFLEIDISNFTKIGIPFDFHFIPIPKNSDVILSGFGQTEKYFKRHKKEILNIFSPTEEILAKYKHIKNTNTTAIHIRRGDYLHYPNHHPTISKEYIEYCLKKINSDSYLIASDDLDWCYSSLTLDKKVEFLDTSDWETLWALSMCKNFILSNSTFSWWAAYLSNTDGNVYVPSSWFGYEYKSYNTKDIACDNWITVPTILDNGKIYPI